MCLIVDLNYMRCLLWPPCSCSSKVSHAVFDLVLITDLWVLYRGLERRFELLASWSAPGTCLSFHAYWICGLRILASVNSHIFATCPWPFRLYCMLRLCCWQVQHRSCSHRLAPDVIKTQLWHLKGFWRIAFWEYSATTCLQLYSIIALQESR